MLYFRKGCDEGLSNIIGTCRNVGFSSDERRRNDPVMPDEMEKLVKKLARDPKIVMLLNNQQVLAFN
jgi:hypothetical protein